LRDRIRAPSGPNKNYEERNSEVHGFWLSHQCLLNLFLCP
jgi:hypothetical protein